MPREPNSRAIQASSSRFVHVPFPAVFIRDSRPAVLEGPSTTRHKSAACRVGSSRDPSLGLATVSEDRLELTANGHVQVRVKKLGSDGTSHLQLTAFEFLEKLAALVPPPRKNLVIYRGLFAPNHKLSARIVAFGRQPERSQAPSHSCADMTARVVAFGRQPERSQAPSHTCAEMTAVLTAQLTAHPRLQLQPRPESGDPFAALPPTPRQLCLPLAALAPTEPQVGNGEPPDNQCPRSPNHSWAFLMQLEFSYDVLACPRRGGRLRYIACITDPRSIDAILHSLGLHDGACDNDAPRAPPPACQPAWQPSCQLAFDFTIEQHQ